MHTHITLEEGKRLRRQTQTSTRSNLHFRRGNAKDYVNYVVDHPSSSKIAVIGKILRQEQYKGVDTNLTKSRQVLRQENL